MQNYHTNDISISVIFQKQPEKYDIKKIFTNFETYKWVEDSTVTMCYNCKQYFNFIVRKHHCRSCGKIFCYNCTNNWIKIPDYIKTTFKKQGYLTISNYMDYLNINNNKEKVCMQCYSNIIEFKKILKTIKLFLLLPLTIIDYKIISQVCKTWYKISQYYCSIFKQIQYFLPHHKYNKNELAIIYNNRFVFQGHSKWIVQLILSQTINTTSIFNKIIKSTKKCYLCKYIFCNKCNPYLTPEDVIICLYNNIYNGELINILLSFLNKASYRELQCYLSLLVFKLRYYKCHKNIVNMFITFLTNKSKNNRNFCNLLFWELTKSIKDVEYQIFYNNIRKKLVHSLDKNTYRLFLTGYDFTRNIVEILKTSKNIKKNIVKHLKTNKYYKDNYFYLPINFNKKFLGIDIDKIKIICSKTNPIILPCIYKDNEDLKLYNIMIKNEDIRKEAIIMDTIKLMDLFIKKDLNIDLNIVTYNILPISNEYGYIEFVNNSYTLYDIREEYNFSIQNFIMEKNSDITANTLRKNFTKSCAAYCVINYLLGFGDRHLDNIMITNNGYIFNIDFGYILGNDPKIISPEFRITTEMIDAMGGINSRYYKAFQEYCVKIYNCLRKHTSIILVQLSLLYTIRPKILNSNLTEKYVINQILKRFIPQKSHIDAEYRFKYKINKNSTTYSGSIIDYFHKKCKTPSLVKYKSNVSTPLFKVFTNITSDINKIILDSNK